MQLPGAELSTDKSIKNILHNFTYTDPPNDALCKFVVSTNGFTIYFILNFPTKMDVHIKDAESSCLLRIWNVFHLIKTEQPFGLGIYTYNNIRNIWRVETRRKWQGKTNVVMSYDNVAHKYYDMHVVAHRAMYISIIPTCSSFPLLMEAETIVVLS